MLIKKVDTDENLEVPDWSISSGPLHVPESFQRRVLRINTTTDLE